MTISDFERAVFSQTATPAEHYDRDYFFQNWGECMSNYSVEARRPIEGKNPQVVKEVFEPKKVLDFGCGPGALLYLLWELCVDAEWLDISRAVRDAAPEA